MRTGLLAVLVLATWLGLQARAAACSCIFPSIENSYQNSDHVLRARAIASLGVFGGQRYYLAVITAAPFKGCLPVQGWVLVQTGADSAGCGISLRPGTEYLLQATSAGRSWGLQSLSVGLCDGSSAWSDVSDSQRAFLDSRSVCCGGSCSCYAGNQAECFADPCQVSQCSVDGAVCTANYCGGCNAEWSDPDGDRVCLSGSAEL